MWKIVYLYIFIFSFFLSCFFVKTFKKAAIKFNLLDKPDSKRKIHTKAIPHSGGIGMYIAFSLSIFIHIVYIYFTQNSVLFPEKILIHLSGIKSILPQLTVIICTTFILVAMGAIDDIRALNAKIKLILQIILALIVFLSGIRISIFIDNIYINALVTVLWIVGITNAFNLMDNMDGLSCGTALIASVIFFIVAYLGSQFFVATILACFSGVLMGFLVFNYPPAKIFMGDAGSLFIGYTLSLLTIVNTYYRPSQTPTIAPVIMPLLILAIPIFDMLSVIFIRLKNRTSILTADKNHLSHRLVNLGMSQKQAVLFIYLINLCIGLSALLLISLNKIGCFIVLIQAIGILTIIVLLERVKQCRS